MAILSILSQRKTRFYLEVLSWINEQDWAYCEEGLFLLPVDEAGSTAVVDQLRIFINQFHSHRFVQFPNGPRLGACPAFAMVKRDGKNVLTDDDRPTILLHNSQKTPDVVGFPAQQLTPCLPIVPDAYPQKAWMVDDDCRVGMSDAKYLTPGYTFGNKPAVNLPGPLVEARKYMDHWRYELLIKGWEKKLERGGGIVVNE